MILHSLELANFRQHAHSVLHFPASGVIGLVGSNEAGKSTILEAIAWALYGQKAARGSKDSIRWNRATARKVAQVRLEFECGGCRYHVTRTETDATVVDTVRGTKVAAGTAAVNEYLPRLIGMGLEEFRNTFLTEQKQLDRIAGMKGTERRQFFMQVLGVGMIDERIERCRARKNALKNEVAGLSVGLGDRDPLVAELAEATAAIESATDAHTQAEADAVLAQRKAADATEQLAASEQRQADRQRAQAEHDKAREIYLAADRETSRVAGQIMAASKAVERIRAAEPYLQPLQMLLEQEVELTRAQLLAGQRADLIRQRDQAERDASVAAQGIADAEAQLGFYIGDFALAGLERDLTEARKELDGLRVARTVALADAKAKADQNAAERKKAGRRLDAIRSAGENGACPTCTRRLAEHFQLVLGELSEEMQRLTAEGSQLDEQLHAASVPSTREVDLEDRIIELEIKVTDARHRKTNALIAHDLIKRETAHRTARLADFDNFEAKLAELGSVVFDEERLAYVKGEIKRLRDMEAALEPDRHLVARAPELEAEHKQRGRAFADAKANVERLEQAVRDVGFDQEEHDVLTAQAMETAARRTDADGRVRETQQQIKSATDWHERATRNLEQYDARATRLTALTAELHTHERTAERMVAFRNRMAATIRPEMEELVSGFVSILTDGRHEAATIDENFEVTLYESGVPVPVVSGGTEDVVAFAMRLAVSQMIAERAGHPLSLLVLDEPWTSLDEIRRAGAISLLRRLRSVFPQIIIVSHIPEIKESVDHCIEIVFDESAGCSRVSAPTLATREGVEVAA